MCPAINSPLALCLRWPCVFDGPVSSIALCSTQPPRARPLPALSRCSVPVRWTGYAFRATIGCMPASGVAPLPRLGQVFFDVRGNSRTMRLSWYAETGVAVFSICRAGPAPARSGYRSPIFPGLSKHCSGAQPRDCRTPGRAGHRGRPGSRSRRSKRSCAALPLIRSLGTPRPRTWCLARTQIPVGLETTWPVTADRKGGPSSRILADGGCPSLPPAVVTPRPATYTGYTGYAEPATYSRYTDPGAPGGQAGHAASAGYPGPVEHVGQAPAAAYGGYPGPVETTDRPRPPLMAGIPTPGSAGSKAGTGSRPRLLPVAVTLNPFAIASSRIRTTTAAATRRPGSTADPPSTRATLVTRSPPGTAVTPGAGKHGGQPRSPASGGSPESGEYSWPTEPSGRGGYREPAAYRWLPRQWRAWPGMGSAPPLVATLSLPTTAATPIPAIMARTPSLPSPVTSPDRTAGAPESRVFMVDVDTAIRAITTATRNPGSVPAPAGTTPGPPPADHTEPDARAGGLRPADNRCGSDPPPHLAGPTRGEACRHIHQTPIWTASTRSAAIGSHRMGDRRPAEPSVSGSRHSADERSADEPADERVGG